MLSVLCVTSAEPYALPLLQAMQAATARIDDAELVLACCGPEAAQRAAEAVPLARRLELAPGNHEPALGGGHAVAARLGAGSCEGAWVLLVADDERLSPALVAWLRTGTYATGRPLAWRFARAHLWGTEDRMLVTPLLWPDHQVRLARREQAQKSPVVFGAYDLASTLAPAVIERHAFLARPHAERTDVVRWMGADGRGGRLGYMLPEDAYRTVLVANYAHGALASCMYQPSPTPMRAA